MSFYDADSKAVVLRHKGDLKAAIALWRTITDAEPCWNHGSAALALGQSLEDIGELAEARLWLETAVRCAPRNVYAVGSLASFVFVHGDAKEALDLHLLLLQLWSETQTQVGIDQAKTAIRSLGAKLGMSPDEVEATIASANAVNRGS